VSSRSTGWATVTLGGGGLGLLTAARDGERRHDEREVSMANHGRTLG
jgi:hypothetical protein